MNAIIETEMVNVENGKRYNGENQMVLQSQARRKNYSSCKWGTYFLWNKLGYKIKKGEKGCTIFYPTSVKTEKVDVDGNPILKSIRKVFVLFNEDQVVKKENVVSENIIQLAA
jgi:Antirestriction protein